MGVVVPRCALFLLLSRRHSVTGFALDGARVWSIATARSERTPPFSFVSLFGGGYIADRPPERSLPLVSTSLPKKHQQTRLLMVEAALTGGSGGPASELPLPLRPLRRDGHSIPD